MNRTIDDIKDPEIRAAAERLEEGRPLTLRERMWQALEAAYADGADISWHDSASERADILNDWAKTRGLIARDEEFPETTRMGGYANRSLRFNVPDVGSYAGVTVYAYRGLASDWRPSDVDSLRAAGAL